MRFTAALLLVGTLWGTLCATVRAQGQPSPGRAFANGPPADPSFFPIGVWLQSPHNAARYAELGINLYVGLYDGPTAAQLEALEHAKMRVFCRQNEIGLAHRGKAIVGWMHDDEPDNAQTAAVGYGPPIQPWKIVEGYEAMRKRDPSRPVLLNLGQGAAWDGWHGRGTRTDHPEDYPEYLKGCDLASFDIYPVTHDHRDVAGRLAVVGEGVRRMLRWSGGKPIFACIETGHVSNAEVRPTPAQIRSEVWIAIACGARGIVYFVHEFAPKFVEASVFGYPEVAAALRAIDAEIAAFAPVLNGPTIGDAVTVATAPADADVAVLAKRDGKALVLFVASLTGEPVTATFTLAVGRERGTVRALGAPAFEIAERKLAWKDHRFEDRIEGYGVRTYRLPGVQ